MADEDRLDIESLLDEGEQDFRMEELAAQEDDPTLEQLRETLGGDAEGLDDTALQKLWDDTKVPEGEVEPTGVVVEPVVAGEVKEGEQVAPEGEVKEVKEGEVKEGEVESFTFESADKLFEHKITVPVDGGQREGSIADFVRMAQRTPMLERRNQELMTHRTAQQGELDEANKEVELSRKDLKWMKWMLEDESAERFQQMREKYLKGEIGEPAVVEPTVDPSTEEGERAQRGNAYYQSTIRPYVQRMARSYSRDGVTAPSAEEAQWMEGEIDKVASQLIEAEGKFLTFDRLNAIFQTDIPYQIDQGGEYRRVDIQPVGEPASTPAGTQFVDAAPPAPTGEVAALKTELANMKTQLSKIKVGSAPDAGGSGAPGGKGGEGSFAERVKNASTAAEIAEILDTDQFEL